MAQISTKNLKHCYKRFTNELCKAAEEPSVVFVDLRILASIQRMSRGCWCTKLMLTVKVSLNLEQSFYICFFFLSLSFSWLVFGSQRSVAWSIKFPAPLYIHKCLNWQNWNKNAACYLSTTEYHSMFLYLHTRGWLTRLQDTTTQPSDPANPKSLTYSQAAATASETTERNSLQKYTADHSFGRFKSLWG